MNLDMVIRFGKYKGKTVKWVMYNDRRYFEWAKENAPQMFEEFKPTGKPRILDTQTEGSQGDLESEDEGTEARDWNNPHLFFEIAQRAMRERGEI